MSYVFMYPFNLCCDVNPMSKKRSSPVTSNTAVKATTTPVTSNTAVKTTTTPASVNSAFTTALKQVNLHQTAPNTEYVNSLENRLANSIDTSIFTNNGYKVDSLIIKKL